MALNIGDFISNVAELSFEHDAQSYNIPSNEVQHQLYTQPTTAEIEFVFSASSSTVTNCTNSQTPPITSGDTTNSYHAGNTIYTQVTDLDQNTNATTRQTVTITLKSENSNGTTVDSEKLIAVETEVDSGIFMAAVPSQLANETNNDCLLGVDFNSKVSASYKDQRNSGNTTTNIIRTNFALIDPYGTVFDSESGAPINGSIVSIYNANPDGSKGSLANVYADAAGSISWPNTVTTGLDFKDANGKIYPGGPGYYWFPFLYAGDYIIEVITPSDYQFGVSTASAISLRNSPDPLISSYLIFEAGSYEQPFTLPPNALPVRIDIPKDPIGNGIGVGLIVEKSTNSDVVGIGELVEYTVVVNAKKTNSAFMNVSMIDTLPRGLRFVPGTAKSSDISGFQQPSVSSNGQELTFTIGTVKPDTPLTISYLAKIGIDSLPGTAINSVFAQDTNGNKSNIALAQIQIKDDLYQETNQIIGQINVDTCRPSNPDKNIYDPTIEKQSHASKEHNVDLSGVRVTMEDGLYAVTDKLGRFHLDNISKGTHVVQLDTHSLPKHLEVIDCVRNTRFAGTPFSRFVDLQGGSLWRTDFYVRQKEILNTNTVTSTTETIATAQSPEINTEKEQKYTKEWLNKQPSSLAILEPTSDNASLGFINIIIQHPNTAKLSVFLNKQPINNATFGKLVKGNKNSLKMWSGVHLKNGKNTISAVLMDSNNTEIQRTEKSIYFSNVIENVELVKEKSRLIADGRTPPVIAVRLTTSGGKPIHSDLSGNFTVNAPYIAYNIDQQKLKSNVIIDRNITPKFTTEAGGIAYIQLEPTTQSGKVSLTFPLNDQEKTLETWLEPELREWIVVGLAEGSVIGSKIKAHMEDLSDEELQETYHNDGRIAFFAKGKIKGKWLLTAAYDTDKKSKERLQNESIDPDLYFTLYGDDSAQYKDGVSSKKLYLKIENHLMYAMFGDFSTNLNTTELSKYSRSFTGLKSEANFKNYNFTAFAAKEDSTYQREEIRGNGTSGPFFLQQKNILINSEKITLETRDRNNPSIVIDNGIKEQSRYIDYNVDYYTGRLTFKTIVPNTDTNFNPVYIVVEYETNAGVEGKTTYGGRVGFKSDNQRFEAGATYVKQNASTATGNLVGLDVKLNPNEHNEIILEVAKTSNELDDQTNTARAYLGKYKYSRENMTVESRVSRQQAGFGLGQQSTDAGDIHQYNIKTTQKLNNHLTLQAEVDHQERISDDKETYQSAGASVNYNHDNGNVQLGYKKTKQMSSATNSTSEYDVIDAGVQQRFGKLNTFVRAEAALNSDESGNKPKRLTVGSDYDINNQVSVFAKSEFTHTKDGTSKLHQTGVKARPWGGAELTTAVNRQTENGLSQDYANYALTQRYALTKNSSIDASYEEGRSISQSNTPFDGLNQTSTVNDAENYKSFSLGYSTHQENWSLQQRVEHRSSDTETRYGFLNRWYRAEKDGIGYGVRTQAFSVDDKTDDSLTRNLETELSAIYRPYDSRWTVMDRLKLSYENVENDSSTVTERKAVNHLRANYIHNDKNQVSLGYGVKHVLQDFEDQDQHSSTIHFIASEYRHDINEKFDVGVHASALFDPTDSALKYSSGVNVGVNLFKNAWTSLGYNFAGFEEEDFDEFDTNSKGWNLDFRVKFDQDTFKLND